MKNSYLAITGLLLLTAPGLAWKSHETTTCVEWNKGRELRCALDNSRIPTATIKVRNNSSSTVSFSYDEWHSGCGSPGGKVESERYRDVEPHESIEIHMLSPGSGVNCRESFITRCERDSREVACPEVLRAETTLWVGNQQ